MMFIDQIRYQVSKQCKCFSHQRISHVVGKHLIGWTAPYFNFVSFYQISNIKQLNVEVSCPFSTAYFTFIFQIHRVSVVLINLSF